jgi:hypothetical protein
MSARSGGQGQAEPQDRPDDRCDSSTTCGPVLVINAALFAGAVGNYASSRFDVTVPAGSAGGSGIVSTSHGAMVLVALDSLARQIEALHAGTAATHAPDTAARDTGGPASAAGEEVRP